MPLEKGHGNKWSQRATRGCLRLGSHQAVSPLPEYEKGLHWAGDSSWKAGLLPRGAKSSTHFGLVRF